MTDDPTHRDVAAALLDAAGETLRELADDPYASRDTDRLIALAQVQALMGIGHALTDLAREGVEVFPA